MAADGSMTATIQALRRDVSALTSFVRRAMHRDDDHKRPAKKLALTTAQVPEVEPQRPPQALMVLPPSASPAYTLSGGLQQANDTLELPRPRDWVDFALFYHVASPERGLYRAVMTWTPADRARASCSRPRICQIEKLGLELLRFKDAEAGRDWDAAARAMVDFYKVPKPTIQNMYAAVCRTDPYNQLKRRHGKDTYALVSI